MLAFMDSGGISSRFTLTMWDVKRIYFTLPTKVIYRFTLTMWDVKSNISWFSMGSNLVLP